MKINVLYRAKKKSDGEWIEGYYAKVKDYLHGEYVHIIFPVGITLYPHSEFEEYEEIIPETLCRRLDHVCYDARHEDRNYFQGDIIEVYKNRYEDIERLEPNAMGIIIDETCYTENGSGKWFPQDTTQIKVVGNVYDNPELVGPRNVERYMKRFWLK